MVLAASQSSHNAVEILYQDHRHLLLAYLKRLVRDSAAAEDLCQETFIKALRGWPQRNPQASVTAWLYRIATNTAYDHLRRRRRLRFRPLSEAESMLADTRAIDSGLGEHELVHVTLAQLPSHYRTILLQHSYGERSIQDIATALGCSDSAVKMRLFRARALFRRIYQAHSPL